MLRKVLSSHPKALVPMPWNNLHELHARKPNRQNCLPEMGTGRQRVHRPSPKSIGEEGKTEERRDYQQTLPECVSKDPKKTHFKNNRAIRRSVICSPKGGGGKIFFLPFFDRDG